MAFCATIVNAQVKVLGKIEPNGPTDTYPTHVDSLGRGGFVAVKTWQERNNIPLPRRKAGMMVSVKSATVDSLYRLGVGLTNVDWMPYNPTVDVSDKASLTTDNYFQGIQNFDSGAYSIAGFWTDGNFEAEGGLQTKSGISLGTDYLSANSWALIQLDPSLPPNSSLDIKMPLSSGRLALTSDLANKANLLGPNSFYGGINSFNYITHFNDELHASSGLYTDGTDIDVSGANINNLGFANFIQFSGSNAYRGQLRGPTSYTASRTYTLPDATGTVALIADIEDKANLNSGNMFNGRQTIAGGGLQVGGNDFGKVTFSDNQFDKAVSLEFTTAGVSGGYGLGFGGSSAYLSILTQDALSDNREYRLPDANGTVALTSDIPKMLSLTASGDGVTGTFQIAHGLSYTPTMISVTANSKDAAVNDLLETSLGNWAYADATYVYVVASKPDGGPGGVVPVSGVNNLKWTIMVK